MVEIKRESPVRFGVTPRQSEVRDNWTVALEYDDEGQGPWIVDLSHKTRWDLQDSNVGDFTPCDLPVPAAPGQSRLAGGTLVNRMNRTQASIYHLGTAAPVMPDDSGYTDVGEATLCVALFGPDAFLVAEKLTNLDLLDPAKTPPFLLQGPFCHVPCQIVPLEKHAEGGGGFLMTCSRGYGDSMVAAIFKAGAEFGLRPAGENRFAAWLAALVE
ncbi:Glycine cleavage T protein (Aminomethyl transferase) [Desulfosarcina cetonica]|uniref:sarcosine oxidase subunit gamma SoxG n=1 Tax=Desulfosarcina cetonica TaxID=90730 RepID=UPI0006D1B28C|nr:sarcosine oxidase subunit gamma SoxG [Desulfosarcina cetonica]VTR67768.1 Glycine cleavage T protein (Aminomethyl transferase) [Desulfosarcina cetonica]